MDWYAIAVAIALVLVLLIGNIYFFAHNAHPNDSTFGSNIFMRALAVFYHFTHNLGLWIHFELSPCANGPIRCLKFPRR